MRLQFREVTGVHRLESVRKNRSVRGRLAFNLGHHVQPCRCGVGVPAVRSPRGGAAPVAGAIRPRPLFPELSQPTAARVGLSDAERAEFYHLDEGSEVFPLTWFMALESETGTGLFAQNLERFGFLPDPAGPANPQGLPVGITAADTRDLRFAGVKMVGVNCAACHTSEVLSQGRSFRLDGAGGQADVTAFYGGLAKATVATVTSPQKFLTFLDRVRTQETEHAAGGSRREALGGRVPHRGRRRARSGIGLRQGTASGAGRSAAGGNEAAHGADPWPPRVEAGRRARQGRRRRARDAHARAHRCGDRPPRAGRDRRSSACSAKAARSRR